MSAAQFIENKPLSSADDDVSTDIEIGARFFFIYSLFFFEFLSLWKLNLPGSLTKGKFGGLVQPDLLHTWVDPAHLHVPLQIHWISVLGVCQLARVNCQPKSRSHDFRHFEPLSAPSSHSQLKGFIFFANCSIKVLGWGLIFFVTDREWATCLVPSLNGVFAAFMASINKITRLTREAPINNRIVWKIRTSQCSR